METQPLYTLRNQKNHAICFIVIFALLQKASTAVQYVMYACTQKTNE